MPVNIGEVELAVPQSASPGRESSGGVASPGGSGMSRSQIEAQVLTAIRRETARLERLWAD